MLPLADVQISGFFVYRGETSLASAIYVLGSHVLGSHVPGAHMPGSHVRDLGEAQVTKTVQAPQTARVVTRAPKKAARAPQSSQCNPLERGRQPVAQERKPLKYER